MPRIIATDSGSTEREVVRFIATDSGGTEREIQRAFVVDSGGTARLFWVAAQVSFPSGPYLIATDSAFESNPELQMGNDGTLEIGPFGAHSFSEPWVVPTNTTTAALFEVRLGLANTVNGSPSMTGSALNTWLSLATTRTWANGAAGTSSNGHVLEVRYTSTGVVVASTTVDFSYA